VRRSGYRPQFPNNCAQKRLPHTDSKYLRAEAVIAHKFRIFVRRSGYRPQIPINYARLIYRPQILIICALVSATIHK